ncbi:hypothetical protein JST97_36930 [bacterium]|nr:hypothetical protein [bacterium]
MTLYAALADVPTALELYDRLLGQNIRVEELSLLSQDARHATRSDSLHIPNFGRVWGLGSLSQASVVAAAVAGGGDFALDCILKDYPAELAEQLRSHYQGGETLIEVSIQGTLERMALAAMLSAYGARLLSSSN